MSELWRWVGELWGWEGGEGDSCQSARKGQLCNNLWKTVLTSIFLIPHQNWFTCGVYHTFMLISYNR